MRRARLVAASVLPLALLALLVAACNESSTEPDRIVPLVGTLARAGTAASSFTMRHTGNVRVRAVDLEQVAADGTTSSAFGGVIVSIGESTGSACVAGGSFGLIKGGVISLGLAKGDYCVTLTEPSGVAEGASLTYNVSLEITD